MECKPNIYDGHIMKNFFNILSREHIDKFINLNRIRLKYQYSCTCVSFIIKTLQRVIARLFNHVPVFHMTTFSASLIRITVLLPQSRDCSCYVSRGVGFFSTSGFLAGSSAKNWKKWFHERHCISLLPSPQHQSVDVKDLDEEILLFALLHKKVSKEKSHHQYWFILCFVQD